MSIKEIIIVGGTSDQWGYIPGFLDPSDPRPVKEQFNEKYMGGWSPFEGFTLDENNMRLIYPGDPPTELIGFIPLTPKETVILFEHSWVMILQNDTKEWEVCRMD